MPASMRYRTAVFLAFTFACASVACGGASPSTTTTTTTAAPIPRARFNQLALRLNLPLLWADDTNGNAAPDPGEVRSLIFYGSNATWVQNNAFTSEYVAALARIHAEANASPPSDPRRALVVEELNRTVPTLIETDMSSVPEGHREFVGHMFNVARLMDQLYARQVGMDVLHARLEPGDTASASLFRKNWGPRCLGSSTETQPACSAIDGAPKQLVDVYPAELQTSDGFCADLEALPEASRLLSPFTVVRVDGGDLYAVPYSEAYREFMAPISAELRAAADAMTDPNETALVTYLRAAATSFETNDWVPADEAWSRMSARNSSWYVRVGPDETYWEPCSQKAGFHLTFARINQGSLVWQDRLSPLRAEMEGALSALTPRTYRPREVNFQLPDFIDIVLNSGDDRDAFGATIGQSLPNWGPVSDDGRGRTVAMSNLYTDQDSLTRRRAQASTLLTAEALAPYTDDQTPALLATILHEATHNLGPSHEYRVDGKTDDDAFGGSLASMLEELKAQSGGLFFVEFLRSRGILNDAQAREVYVDSIVWTFGHVSRGMYTPSGQRKAYSQLAAVQIGVLMELGALTWDASASSADGTRGAFSIDYAKLPEACTELMRRVMVIKSTADRAAAEALATRFVDGDRVPHAAIVDRYRNFPQASFVFSVRSALGSQAPQTAN